MAYMHTARGVFHFLTTQFSQKCANRKEKKEIRMKGVKRKQEWIAQTFCLGKCSIGFFKS